MYSFPYLIDINVLFIYIYIYCPWTKVFPCRQANPSTVVKILLENIVPIWGTPLELSSDRRTHFTGQELFTAQVQKQVCAIGPVLQHFHCAHHLQSSGLVEHSNGIIKIQLAKLVETLQIPWPKVLPLVLLNLRSTPFGTHKLLPFKIITGRPMYLAPASLDP